MDYNKESLRVHEENKGKLEVISKVKLENKDDLSIAYTPGVAEPCREIHKNEKDVYKYTSKGNLVAVVTDGSAVLGLGDIGPKAALPVMEGKAVLFKEFAGVDAIPICLDTQSVNDIVNIVKAMSPTFGGINLEDISAPRCIEIEKKLKEQLDIPVFHDDQHGTAIVVTAALINALKLVKKEINQIKTVVNGAGAAGSAIVKMLLTLGVKDIIVCDRKGILYKGAESNDWSKEELAGLTNKQGIKGDLRLAMENADVFIGVSAANVVDEDMVKSMNQDAIVFAMANPNPEIIPELALKAGARVAGSGRSDYINQVNNVLAFPGIFRGALDVRATDINEEMKLAAAYAIASIISEDELKEDYIIPNPLDKRVANKVAKEVAQAAIRSNVTI
ncbi:NAD-dependent malic enzyme [Clostridiaceae bacterium M8S5]|nr:NAD-dependent malic enzyme [Clostridiaceae bacterium M8S5]